MVYFTTNTYTLKREILNFTNKIFKQLSKPERKFTADMTYGMLAAGSCLLTDVVDQLHEDSKKINIVDRLSRHLDKGVPAQAASSYLQQIKKWVPSEPVIHIDDSDVVKSGSYKFESLGIVRDGSESTSAKNVYKKGYHVTEACVLTTGNHPVSIFSKVHSSAEKGYKSANTVTFEATELRNRRKGKIKTNVFYKGKNHEAYISHVKVQITALRKSASNPEYCRFWFIKSWQIGALEEVIYSDLLCHVVDTSSDTAIEQIKAVEEVLSELGASDKKTILVLNKIDKATEEQLENVKKATSEYETIEISAREGINLEELLGLIEENLPYKMKKCEYLIPYDRSDMSSFLHRNGRVLEEDYRENGTFMFVEVDEESYNKSKDYIINIIM